jgi:redox-regulated HSP33 family molecular chaperone
MPNPLPQDSTQVSIAKRVQNELASRTQNVNKVSRVTDVRKEHSGSYEYHDTAFHCECDDALCKAAISIPTQVYEQEHAHPNRFIVKSGHAHTDIEKVIQKYSSYMLVEKFSKQATDLIRKSEQSRMRREENEVIFRERNEDIKNLVKSAAPNPVGDLTLRFTCECSNEECTDGIDMTIQNYELSRGNKRQFFVKIGHEQRDIERVVNHKDYNVVEKFNEPPSTDGKLNRT